MIGKKEEGTGFPLTSVDLPANTAPPLDEAVSRKTIRFSQPPPAHPTLHEMEIKKQLVRTLSPGVSDFEGMLTR